MRVGALYAVLRLEKGQFEAALATSQTKWGAFMGLIKAGALISLQAIAVIAAGSLVMAATFEQHMNQSLAIMDGVTSEIRAKMEAAARAVAKTSTFSANEAADAYYFLASAGYTAEQSIAALPKVTQFAQAGVMDLEAATELLMDTQTTMGLRTKDATQNMENMARVSDVLAAAQIGSNATLQQMAEALTNKAGPALRVVGKDIEEGAAALMVLANRGVKGREAGTALAIVLRELQTKAIKNKDAFAEAGVAVFDASGNMRNMADIVGDLEGHLEGLTDEQKKEALLTLGFTDRSVGFIQAILGSSDELRKYEDQLRSAGGTTEDVANKQLDTFQNQLTITWHKIQDVAISIGQKLLPGAKEMVTAIGNWIDANGELIASLAIGLFDAIGKAIGLIGELVRIVGRVLTPVFEALAPVVQTVMGVIRGAVWVVQEALAGNADTLDTLGGGWKTFGDITQAVVGFITDDLIPALGDAFTWLQEDVMPMLAEGFVWFADNVAPVFAATLDHITQNVIPFLGEMIAWISNEVVPVLIRVFSKVADDVIPAVAAVFDFVATQIIPRLADAFTWFAEDVVPILQTAFMGIVKWFSQNWPTISSIAGQVLGAVGEAFKVVADVIGFVVPIIWGIVQPIAAVLFPNIAKGASILLGALDVTFKLIGGIFDVVGDIARSVYRGITRVWDGMASFFGGVWRGVSGAFKSGINVVIDLVNGFIGFLNNMRFDIPEIGIPGTDIKVGGGAIDPFNIGLIPHLARGVRSFGGGLAMIGERGPELMYVPRGADVYNAGETASLMSGNGRIEVVVRDPDGAIRAGGYSQKQIERVVSEAVREMVGGARHRSLRQGAS